MNTDRAKVEKLLDNLYLDAWGEGRKAEREQTGIRSVTPKFKEEADQIMQLLQEARIDELQQLFWYEDITDPYIGNRIKQLKGDV